MALDPNIALGVQPAQIQNPLTAYAQVAAIQDAQQRNRLLDLSIQDKQREVSQNAALSKAYADNLGADGNINSQGLLTSLAQSGNGAAIPGVQKSLSDAATAKLAQQKSQIELSLQQTGALAQVLGGVRDQASYDAALQHAAQSFGPQAVANLPAQYDPQFVSGKLNEALTVQQRLEEQHKATTEQLQQAQFVETQRHNQVSEANTVRGQDLTANTALRGQNIGAQEYDPKTGNVVNKITGLATPARDAQGNPVAAPTANLTETQGAATAFAARASDAQRIIRDLEAGGTTGPGMVNRLASGLPVVGGAAGAATNFLNSDQQQSYTQAKKNFITAVLRKESGAVIGDNEFRDNDHLYFPQPGDSDATIAQKARARDLAIEAIKAQAGPGASMIPGIIDKANQDGNQSRPGAQQPAARSATPAQIPVDAARAELLRRAQNNPALMARLQAMGH